ncbi:DUF2795 domain-containing protein [Microbacterium sp. BK668]|uniref:DUF2795 domain-containing protein n=1 Tax=Microbacterium sp. BK668 TaxID=2512118 RepID=UPI0010601AE8|nr:DUF2795 domain-containing protein [Microbacterium sp. BK668]TDN92021.1 uncharacterized protein DUF2795 [Microbacterium sp. BK668]
MADQPNPIDLQKHLAGVDYPASRATLVEAARRNGAPDDIVSALENAGRDDFETPAEVSAAVFDR